MPNILLTQQCVRSCPYCFAKKHMSDAPPDDILSWEDLIYVVDLIEDSGERRISLLGGEPALHPEFTNFIIYLLERDFNITVFTSGIMSDDVLTRVESSCSAVDPDRLVFICNLNEPDLSPPEEILRVERFLELLGPRIGPGFNIYRRNFSLDFLIHYINQYGLKRSIRLGMAHPIPGMKNRFIKIEDMSMVIDRLMSYSQVLERFRISLGPDCGFPLCGFSDAQLGWMHKMTGGMLRFGCGPAIDIGPDMSVWSCFPLSNWHKKSVYDFDSLHDIHHYFESQHNIIRNEMGGIFEACDDCRFREEGICAGGCAAHLLSCFKDEAPVRLPEIYQ